MASVMQLPNRRTGEPSRFWTVRFVDHTGKLRQKSSRSTEKRVAEQLARRIEEQQSRLRAGLLTPAEVNAAEQSRRPLLDHVGEYLAHCLETGQAPRAVLQKRSTLHGLAEGGAIGSLGELTPQRVRRFMSGRRNAGDSRKRGRTSEPLSARTWNAIRQQVLAFANWCVAEGRILRHELGGAAIPKLREETDRRRQRRSLLPDQVADLLRVAAGTPRAAVYLVAVHTGLRRSELAGLRWRDLDADAGTLTVQASLAKSRKATALPLHPEALRAILQLHSEDSEPQDRIFRQLPKPAAVYADLEAAGIQARDADGKPVPDAGGGIVDFHSLRGTAATNWVRAGVKPAHLTRLMRHADIKTTERHYIGLGLSDMRGALEQVADYLAEPVEQVRTGTAGGADSASARWRAPSEAPSVPAHSGALACMDVPKRVGCTVRRPVPQASDRQAITRRAAPQCTPTHQAGEGTRTLDIQLGKQGRTWRIPRRKQASANALPPEAPSVSSDLAMQLVELVRRWPTLNADARRCIMQAAGMESDDGRGTAELASMEGGEPAAS